MADTPERVWVWQSTEDKFNRWWWYGKPAHLKSTEESAKYIRADVVEERLDNLLWIARNARQVVDVIYEFVDEAHEEDVPDGFAYVADSISDLDDQLREYGFPPTESANEEKYRAEVLGE